MQVGDIGVPIDYETVDRLGVVKNVTGATSITFHLLSPAGSSKTLPGVVQDGANGLFRAVTAAASDIDTHGDWFVQVAYVLAGFNGRTELQRFKVGANA